MELALFILRVTVGMLLVGHGAQKVFGWFKGYGPTGTGAFFETLGIRPGRPMAVGAGAAEMTGGLLLAFGLLVPVAAMLIISVMAVAVMTAHRGKGPWAQEGGWEYNVVIGATAFAVAATGPGEWSLDYALGINWAGDEWALAALAAGLIGAIVTIAVGRASRPAPTPRHGRATPVT